jgi:hypothetical protein
MPADKTKSVKISEICGQDSLLSLFFAVNHPPKNF